MSKIALIAVLVICVLLLVLFLAVFFEKMKNAVLHMRPGAVGLIVVMLLAVTAFICVLLFAPRGEGSLLAENKEAESTGTADFDAESLLNKCLAEATAGNAEGDRAVYIRVSGSNVNVGEKHFKSVSELKDFLGILAESDLQYVLVDDFASLKTYREVTDVLGTVGIGYKEIEE